MEKIKALKGYNTAFGMDGNTIELNLESTFYYMLYSTVKKHKRVSLNIPETIIFGFGFETPCLMYTNSKGYIKQKSNISSRTML